MHTHFGCLSHRIDFTFSNTKQMHTNPTNNDNKKMFKLMSEFDEKLLEFPWNWCLNRMPFAKRRVTVWSVRNTPSHIIRRIRQKYLQPTHWHETDRCCIHFYVYFSIEHQIEKKNRNNAITGPMEKSKGKCTFCWLVPVNRLTDNANDMKTNALSNAPH